MREAMEPVIGPAVWMGCDLAGRDDWNLRLTAADIAELDTALAAVARRGIPLRRITVADFPLPRLGVQLRALADELESGRGFGVIRGVPVETYSEDDCKVLSWGLCSYFGVGMPQTRQGDWINHVIDVSDVTTAPASDFDHVVNRRELRANNEGGELRWHTDSADIVGLFCLRKAVSGGACRLASAAMVHNLILERSPDCLAALYQGFRYMSLADDNGDGTPRVSAARVPVFRREDEAVRFYYIPQVVERAIERANIACSAVEDEARELIQSTAEAPGVALDFMLEPGDLEVINNRIVMHARESFEDHPDIDRRRHMLRLWMTPTPETVPHADRSPSDQYRDRIVARLA